MEKQPSTLPIQAPQPLLPPNMPGERKWDPKDDEVDDEEEEEEEDTQVSPYPSSRSATENSNLPSL